MTDEPVDTGSNNPMSSGDAEPDDDRAKTVISFGHRGDVYGDQYAIYMPEQLALFTAVAVYSKAFLEALAKRHADGLADVVRKHLREKYKNTEAEIGLDSDEAATVVVTGDLPDEARLALLDLDVTADELRGKVLRWDENASAWQPADDK